VYEEEQMGIEEQKEEESRVAMKEGGVNV